MTRPYGLQAERQVKLFLSWTATGLVDSANLQSISSTFPMLIFQRKSSLTKKRKTRHTSRAGSRLTSRLTRC